MSATPCTKCIDGLIWVEVCHPTQTRCSCQPAPPMVVTTTNDSAQFVTYAEPAPVGHLGGMSIGGFDLSPVPVGTTAPFGGCVECAMDRVGDSVMEAVWCPNSACALFERTFTFVPPAAPSSETADTPTKRRLNAYYYGFDPTGVDEIDAILEAVARAGKSCHHTEGWEEHGLVQRIQDAANNAARAASLAPATPPLENRHAE